jgi:hypothetical protein
VGARPIASRRDAERVEQEKRAKPDVFAARDFLRLSRAQRSPRPRATGFDASAEEHRMYGGKSSRQWAYGDTIASLGPRAIPAVLAVAAAGVVLLLPAHLRAPLVLPILSVASLAIAGFAALFAWWSGCERHSAQVTGWDVSGAFALIGCAAAMLSEPDSVLRALDQAMAGH